MPSPRNMALENSLPSPAAAAPAAPAAPYVWPPAMGESAAAQRGERGREHERRGGCTPL